MKLPIRNQKSNFFKQILSKYPTKSKALEVYLKKIVIYQSTNKDNSNWNELRRSALDMTLRQISDLTGVSLTQVHRVIKSMLKRGIIKVYKIKKSKHRQNMVFYYFPDIKRALIKKKAFNLVKKGFSLCKGNTRNIIKNNKYKYKSFVKFLTKYQSLDDVLHWSFDNKSWEREYFKPRNRETLHKLENKPVPTFADMLKLLG